MHTVEPPPQLLSLLHSSLPTIDDETAEILAYVATLASALSDSGSFSAREWHEALEPYLSSLPSLMNGGAREVIDGYLKQSQEVLMENEVSSDEEDVSFVWPVERRLDRDTILV